MVSDTVSVKHKNCNMIVSFHSKLEGANYIKLLNQNPNILVTYYQGTLHFKQLIKSCFLSESIRPKCCTPRQTRRVCGHSSTKMKYVIYKPTKTRSSRFDISCSLLNSVHSLTRLFDI